jgi:hypothetical protein
VACDICSAPQKQCGHEKGKYLPQSRFRKLPAHPVNLGIYCPCFEKPPVVSLLLRHLNDTQRCSGTGLLITGENLRMRKRASETGRRKNFHAETVGTTGLWRGLAQSWGFRHK